MNRLFAIVLMLALVSCGEQRSASFADVAEARASGIIEKGWIPPEISRDATDIRVQYNLDTNISEGSYRAATIIAPSSGANCRSLRSKPQAIQCHTFIFRTEGKRRLFSNRSAITHCSPAKAGVQTPEGLICPKS